MSKLSTYLKAAHDLLDISGDAYAYQALMETQFFAGDLEGARDTARRIADPESRMYAWTQIFSACLEHDDAAAIWALLEDETLLNGHLDFLSYILEDDKLSASELRALLARTDPQALEMRAAIWSALARQGEPDEAVAFFEQQTLPAYMQDNWHADVAIGFAKQGNLVAALKHLTMSGTGVRAGALIKLGAQGIDQAFLDQEVDAVLEAAFKDEHPNVGLNTLRDMTRVAGQWPRLSSRIDLLEDPDRKLAQFQAVWLTEGVDAAWTILCDVAPCDANNAIVGALHDGTDYFANRAVSEWDDAETVNNIRGALLLRALKTDKLDSALTHVLAITPVADPPESMQPYYRDSSREHVSEALLKAGRLDALVDLHSHFEQPMRQLSWACKIALALINADRLSEARMIADVFHTGFDQLSSTDPNHPHLLNSKAALFIAFDQFDAGLALAKQAEDWSRNSFPADAVSIAASCGRHVDRMAQIVHSVWENSARDDINLLNTVIAATYALQEATTT